MTEQSDKKRIDLKTTQVAAGSLASVTSAVAASQLGVAGTLVGAGVGSVVGTVAGAVYQHYLDRTHHHVRTVVPRRTADSQTTVDMTTVAASAPLESPVASEKQGQPTWAWLRSRRLALALSAAAALGIAIVALTGFETVTGQSVSAGSGDNGTSIGRVFGGASTDSDADSSPTPSSSSSAGDEATSTPTPSQGTTATEPATPRPSTPSTSPTTAPVPEPTIPNAG